MMQIDVTKTLPGLGAGRSKLAVSYSSSVIKTQTCIFWPKILSELCKNCVDFEVFMSRATKTISAGKDL